MKEPFHLVLFEPMIPPNTGNVGRLCVGTGAKLHLIEPLGFDISEKAVRRAGLDYWKHIDLVTHKNYQAFRASVPEGRNVWLISKFGKRTLFEAKIQPGDYFVFGKETTGLTKEIHESEPADHCLNLPMPASDAPSTGNVEHGIRCLNLAGTAHIVLYEAMRQTGF